MKNRELRATYIYHAIKPTLVGVIFSVFLLATLLCFFNGAALAGIVMAILAAVPLLFFLIAIGQLIACRVYEGSYDNYKRIVAQDDDRIILIEGLQGTGKTDTAKRAAIIKAAAQWEILQTEYFTLSNRLPKILSERDAVALERWKEVSNVYKWYRTHPDFYPCLMSNCGFMTVEGRKVMEFSYAMLVQEANLGYRTVLILDELSSSGLTNRFSAQASPLLDQSLRFLRQFYEGYIYATEQDKYKAILNLRSVAVNYTMEEMKKDVLAPRMLRRYYEKKRAKLMDRYPSQLYRYRGVTDLRYGYADYFRYVNRYRYERERLLRLRAAEADRAIMTLYRPPQREVEHLIRIKRLIDGIGYIRYTRIYRGSTEGNNVNDANKSATDNQVIGHVRRLRYYMPAARLYEGESRVFSGINRAKDYPFVPKSFDQKIMTRAYWDEMQRESLRVNVKLKELAKAQTPTAQEENE